MKKNARTVKLTADSHRLASSLSNRFAISMTAAVELALRHLSEQKTLTLLPRDPRSKKSNIRRALAQ